MADLDERFRSLSRSGSPDLWPDIETREPRSGLPPAPLAHRALAGAIALVIAVAGIGFAAVTFGSSEQQPAPGGSGGPSPESPTSAEVVETFAVGEDVRSVAYGEGSVWVAVSNNDGSFGGRIVRIDPETHDVQAEIQVDAIPSWEVGGGAMVFADGDLWVAGDLEAPGAFDDPGGGADAVVVRIDTSTNEVTDTLDLGGTSAADLTFLDGELWVLVFGDETVDNAMEVIRVDPRTGEVGARITLETGWAHSIVAADDRLVVLESGEGATNVGGVGAVLDPVSGDVTRTDIPSHTFVPTPVVWRGQVWVGVEPGFARFDLQRGAFPFTSRVSFDPEDMVCCGSPEADDRGIWFHTLESHRLPGQLLKVFDPATGRVTSLALVDEGTPVAMAVAPDSVWILNYEGTLTHVALG